jgi:hypothetical protein
MIADTFHLPPSNSRHPDARLIELGNRHSEILKEIARNEAEYDAVMRSVGEECAVPIELSGIARHLDRMAADNDMAPLSGVLLGSIARGEIDKPSATWSPGWPAGLTRSGKFAILEPYEAAIEVAFERHGKAAVSARGEALGREESAILNEIRDTPALTIAGIAVKLRAAATLGAWSVESEEEGYSDHLLDETLRNAERLAGLAPPPERS